MVVPGTLITIADHTQPLNADVHLETYAWNYSFADYFVIFNYSITNSSPNVWDSVWCGMWSDIVVRNVNVSTDFGSAFLVTEVMDLLIHFIPITDLILMEIPDLQTLTVQFNF